MEVIALIRMISTGDLLLWLFFGDRTVFLRLCQLVLAVLEMVLLRLVHTVSVANLINGCLGLISEVALLMLF